MPTNLKEAITGHFGTDYSVFYSKYLKQITKIGGDEFKALCPFHEENEPSFNFNSTSGQFFCHGCNKKGDIFRFYAKSNGANVKADFPKILHGIAGDFGIVDNSPKRRIAKTYDYVDEAGNMVFQVCRMEPKEFFQRRPGANGKWVWNLKGIDRILYRLPEVNRASDVIICEGEKDCDNLAALGFTATCNAGGAGKWQPSYSEALKGKTVFLCPDNDKAGREHMVKVAQSLNGNTRALKWLELNDLPSKGDVTDWLSRFTDKETAAESLSNMLDGAKDYSPPKNATIEDVVVEAEAFSLLELPVKHVLLHPWLSEQSIALVTGYRGTGKTWFGMSICDAITKGESFGPWSAGEPAACLYLEGEMAAQDIRERFDNFKCPNRPRPLYVYSDAYANHMGLSRANLMSEKWRGEIYRILTGRHVRLWVADNLASLTGGIDENAKKEWDPINQWLLELRFAGISTVLLHHTNKEGGQRGTSAREDNIDCSIILKRPFDYSAEDGARFVASFSKARVRAADLSLVGDTEFKLILDDHGSMTWVWNNVRRENRLEIIRMFDDGSSNQTIADSLGLSKGYVSKTKASAIRDGHLTSKGKLTQSGFDFINAENGGENGA